MGMERDHEVPGTITWHLPALSPMLAATVTAPALLHSPVGTFRDKGLSPYLCSFAHDKKKKKKEFDARMANH